MALEDEIALALTENEILLRRNHLRAVADELAERCAWLDQLLPSDQVTPLPPNDWAEFVEHDRIALAAAREALLAQRAEQVMAQEAALLLWQMQLDTMAEAVRIRERAHRQTTVIARAALNRTVEAPELSVGDRKPPRVDSEQWMVTLDLPRAPAAAPDPEISRRRTTTMTPEDSAAADRAVLSRATKRRTARMSPIASPAAAILPDATDPRDLTPLTTPHDLPTIAPAAMTAPTRHRGRSVTEPFVAALDLDGLYLQRQQLTFDAELCAVRVQLYSDTRVSDREDMPARPERMTYRSREGDTHVFRLREVELRADNGEHRLVLHVQHWTPDELQAFRRALETLP